MKKVDASNPEAAVFRWLGTMDYEPALALQRSIRDRLIADKRSGAPEGRPHVILGVVHPPVYTLGKSGDGANLLASGTDLERIGASAVHIDRGGDVTFHGPGQLVVYPILDLERLFTDLGRYLRTLEDAVIETLAAFSIAGRRVAGRTGVWVGPDERGPERKICAMGIHCSRWVTTHGLALNVETDLSYFDHIVPCGIRDRGVTSIRTERQSGPPLELEDIFYLLIERIASGLGLALAPARETEPASHG